MTAQTPDFMLHRRKHYEVAAVRGGRLFDPAGHGLTPRPMHTACQRGYVCDYRVSRRRRRLDALELGTDGTAPPPLFGVAPDFSADVWRFNRATYGGLRHPVPHTGGVLIARDFVEELYVHMGFHPAWKYREVRELLFRDGVLVGEADLSDRASRRRDRVRAAGGEPDPLDGGNIVQWINDRFRQAYDL